MSRVAQLRVWPTLQRPALACFCLRKDVDTVNKTPIASKMTEGLYKYLMAHTREPNVCYVTTVTIQGVVQFTSLLPQVYTMRQTVASKHYGFCCLSS